MVRSKLYYENRIALLESRPQNNYAIIKKLRRKIRNLNK